MLLVLSQSLITFYNLNNNYEAQLVKENSWVQVKQKQEESSLKPDLIKTQKSVEDDEQQLNRGGEVKWFQNIKLCSSNRFKTQQVPWRYGSTSSHQIQNYITQRNPRFPSTVDVLSRR